MIEMLEDPSLGYEIMLYVNSFYFGLFAMCELSTLILKTVLLISQYYDNDHQNVDSTKLARDYGIMLAFFFVEVLRLILGRKGSLSERDIPVFISVVLNICFSFPGVAYLWWGQAVVLLIEKIWCFIMIVFLGCQLILAFLYFIQACRGPSYD